MIKVEIKLNRNKINKEKRYTIDHCSNYVKELFKYYDFEGIETKDNSLVFYGNNDEGDFRKFANIISFLKDSDIFQYIEKIVGSNIPCL